MRRRDPADRMRLVPDPGGTAYTLVVGGTPQSHVDLADPTRLEFEYVQRIADLLDAVAPPGARITAVHVGGAGLTLPRYVACTRPGSNQVVLEPDVALTALVRDRLPLPRASGIKVRAVDGAGGMATVRDALADVVVVDAFVEARVPAQLTTTGFLAQVRRVLRPAGVAVLNVTDRAPFGYTRRVLAGARTVFTDVAMSAEAATLKGRRFGNVLVYAGNDTLAYAVLERSAAGAPSPYRFRTGRRLASLVGGAVPFTGENASASPEPPQDFFAR